MSWHPFRHVGLKLSSVALAVLLWFAIAGDPVVERSLRVPLELQNIPAGLELVGDLPTTVEVRLRGPATLLSRLGPGETPAVIDLRGARPGRRLFHLTAASVRVPFGVTVAHVRPTTVGLTLERAASRVVPVVPQVEGQPAPGYAVTQVTVDPPTVEIVGPESRLRAIAEATTDEVSVEGLSAPVRERVTVGVFDPLVHLRTPVTATVSVAVGPAPVERVIEGVAVRARHLAPGWRAELSPSVVAIRVRGARDAVRTLAPDQVEASVDLAGLGVGRYNLPVRVEGLPQVGVVRIDPPTVAVRIR